MNSLTPRFHVPELRWIGLALALTGLAACSPSVYLIDRPTVLEVQAAGDWPELDRVLLETAVDSGPAALEQTSEPPEARALLHMTHGDDDGLETGRERSR